MKPVPIIFCGVFLVCAAGVMVEWSNRAAIASSIAEFESYDYRDGRKEAEADILHGTPKWKVSGRVSDVDEHTARLNRLGIALDWFADCIATEGIVRYRYNYNSTIRAHFVGLVGEETTLDVIGRTLTDDRHQNGSLREIPPEVVDRRRPAHAKEEDHQPAKDEPRE